MLRCGLTRGVVGLQDAVARLVVLNLKTAKHDLTTNLVTSPLEFMQLPNVPTPRLRV